MRTRRHAGEIVGKTGKKIARSVRGPNLVTGKGSTTAVCLVRDRPVENLSGKLVPFKKLDGVNE